MALKLRIISEQYKQLGTDGSRLFGVTGGRIGRAPDNDWILPDPERYVSSHHAKVSFQSGQWVLEDVSTNGVFVNESDTALSVTGPRKLRDGDRLRFGDYDILVTIDDRNDFPPDATGQMTRPAPTSVAKPRGKSSKNFHLDNDLGEELDITGLFQTRKNDSDDVMVDIERPPVIAAPPPPRSTPTPNPPTAAAAPAASTAAKHNPEFEPALTRFARELPARPAVAVVAAAPSKQPAARESSTPESPSGKWHMNTRRLEKNAFVSDTSRNPVINPPEVSREVSAKKLDTAESQHAFDSFCRGAGVDMGALNTESQSTVMTLAGQMLREAILDLMEVLKTGPELAPPEVPGAAVNPIKSSASVEDVLRRLIQARGMRQLGAIEALRDAFGEIRDQRTACDHAALAAVNDLIKRVDPLELQDRFDRGLKRTNTPQAAYKGKYWDLFVEFYPLVNQRDPRNSPAVYADEFARKYSEKLAELRQRRRR
jgi:type VI secretion system protein